MGTHMLTHARTHAYAYVRTACIRKRTQVRTHSVRTVRTHNKHTMRTNTPTLRTRFSTVARTPTSSNIQASKKKYPKKVVFVNTNSSNTKQADRSPLGFLF